MAEYEDSIESQPARVKAWHDKEKAETGRRPFEAGVTVESPEDPEAMAAESDAKLRANIAELKTKLARVRKFAAQAEAAYSKKYPSLMAALDKTRAEWEKENALVIAENDRAKDAAERVEKDLRGQLVDFYLITKQKTFDEHLSVRVGIKLDYELEKATEWAKTNAPFMLIADKKQFEKHAKDKKVHLDFVEKTEDPVAVVASVLPLDSSEEAASEGEQAASEPGPLESGVFVRPPVIHEACPGCGQRPCNCVPI